MFLSIIGKFIVPIIIILVLLIIMLTGYVKAPPDTAYIISGLKKAPRILIGRAGIKIPYFERLDKLYLGQITVDIKTESPVPTNDFINVNVDAVAKVRVATDRQINIGTDKDPIIKEGIFLAAKNFLNKKPDAIAKDLQDSLQGNMREIIGTLSLKAINTDRDSFSDQVMEKASKDMDKLGIEIISCNIQNVTDENGLINDLGADNTSKIKKDAAIAKAIADKEVAIEQAKADKEANAERVAADTEIAQRENDLAIKKAELKKQSDTAKADADAAYKIQSQVRQKDVETATVNAQIAKTEREAELKEKEVQVKKQELSAEVERKADAEKYQKQTEAEAGLIEQQKLAEAKKAVAEAQRYAAEQEAEGIKAKLLAEAEGIRAKGEAEAEAMQKKAEAYQKYGDAAKLDMLTKIMPAMAEAIATPLSSIKDVTIYGGGEGKEIADYGNNTPLMMKQVFDTMTDATGVDFREILKSQTYDAKVKKDINLSGTIPQITTTEKKEEKE